MICCNCLSLNLELSPQTDIARIFSSILLELKCHSSINIWVFALVFNCSKRFELEMTHIGAILNLYLKTGVSLCLEGRMMLTIINLTKIFTRREKAEAVYF